MGDSIEMTRQFEEQRHVASLRQLGAAAFLEQHGHPPAPITGTTQVPILHKGPLQGFADLVKAIRQFRGQPKQQAPPQPAGGAE
jgi:hypothetical protein